MLDQMVYSPIMSERTEKHPRDGWESKLMFESWLEAMEWSGHGGIQAAANALGKDRRMVERYLSGETKLKFDTRLAMAAIKLNLMPWGDKTEHVAGNFVLFGGVQADQISIGDRVRIGKPGSQFYDAIVLQKASWGDAFKVQIIDGFVSQSSWVRDADNLVGKEVLIWPQHIYMGLDKKRNTYRSTPNQESINSLD